MNKYFLQGEEVKIGDKLRIVKESVRRDPDGMGEGVLWTNGWTSDMSNEIGKIGTVKSIDSHGVNFKEMNYGWPLSACERLEIEGEIEIGDTVFVNNAEGCATFKDFVGKNMIVNFVYDAGSPDTGTLIGCEGVEGEQFKERFKLVKKAEKKFGIDDLKAMQRVVTKDGRTAVVNVSEDGKKYIHYFDAENKPQGFDCACFDSQHSESIRIIEVYEAPLGKGYLFNFSKRGVMLYDANKVAKQKALIEAEKKVIETQTKYAAATGNMVEARDALWAAESALKNLRK